MHFSIPSPSLSGKKISTLFTHRTSGSFFLFVFLCLFAGTKLLAQQENNIWLFGDMGGITFNSGTPQLYVGSAMNAYIPSVSVCNATGQLQFYSEGTKVWNRNHVLMPNGSGLVGNFYPTITQGVIAMPFLNDTTKYYLFTLEGYQPNNPGSKFCLRYSIINMTLNGGLGDIIAGQKNILLDSFMSESLTTVRGSGCYNWLLAHKQNEGKFVAYKIDATGIISVVSSSVSALPFPSGNNPYRSQEMKVSPDNTKIGWANNLYASNTGNVELYDFNNTTGIVSNGLLLDTFWNSNAGDYGIAFSPDNKKFYYSNFSFGQIYQMDLDLLPNLTAVKNSKTGISNVSQSITGLRLGPDNKIYAKSPIYVSMINNPNGAGAACNFTFGTFTMSANYGWRLGDNVVINKVDTFYSKTDTALCFLDTAWFTAPAGGQNYLWSDGSTSPTTIFTAPGTKWVKSNQGCSFHIDTFVVTALAPDTTFYSHDTSFCFLLSGTLSAPNGYNYFIWNNGSTAQQITITQGGIYQVRSRNGCNLRSDTFHVINNLIDTLKVQHDTTICFQQSASLNIPATYDEYLWDNGNTGPQRSITQDGVYWVKSKAIAGCIYRLDSFKVIFHDFSFDLGNDTTLCKGDTLLLSPGITNGTYRWSDGSAAPLFTIKNIGKYSVTINVGTCKLSDTITVSEKKLTADFGPDRYICKDREASTMLHLGNEGSLYNWSNGSHEESLKVDTAGTYWGIATQGSCIATDTIDIDFVRCDHCINVPNAFSPNGDSKNDFFQAQVYCPLQSFKMNIYNRYGQLIFSGKSPDDYWNGTFNGNPCDAGTYFYYLEMTTDTPDKSKINRKGDITLIR
jgi:gliding motility-associated-like protein